MAGGDGAPQEGSLSPAKGGKDERSEPASHRPPTRHHEERPAAGGEEEKRGELNKDREFHDESLMKKMSSIDCSQANMTFLGHLINGVLYFQSSSSQEKTTTQATNSVARALLHQATVLFR